MLIIFRRTRSFLDLVRCSTSLRITKPSLKWSSKAEVQQCGMYPEPTELLLIDCLTQLIWIQRFDSSMSTPNTNSQTFWQEGNFTRDERNKLFHWFNISHFSSFCCAQNFSLTSCTRTMAKGMQEQQRNNRIVAKSKSTLSRQVLRLWTVRLRRKAWGYTKHPVEQIGQVQGNLTQEIAITTQRRVLKDGKKVAVLDVGTKKAQGNLSLQDIQELQETQETREPKALTKIGHTISIIHQTMCYKWTESSRSWDKDMVEVRRIKWKTSMWTLRNGLYLCLSLFKLQFILGKITRQICDLPRINPWNFWDSYFKWLRGWSRIRQKLLDWPRLIGSSLCGERRLCWLTQLFSSELPKPTSFLTQCRVWEVSVTKQSQPASPANVLPCVHWLRVVPWIAVLSNCREFSQFLDLRGFRYARVTSHNSSTLGSHQIGDGAGVCRKKAELLTDGLHDVVDAAGNTVAAVGICVRIPQIPSGQVGPPPASLLSLRYDILRWRLSCFLGLLFWLLAQSVSIAGFSWSSSRTVHDDFLVKVSPASLFPADLSSNVLMERRATWRSSSSASSRACSSRAWSSRLTEGMLTPVEVGIPQAALNCTRLVFCIFTNRRSLSRWAKVFSFRCGLPWQLRGQPMFGSQLRLGEAARFHTNLDCLGLSVSSFLWKAEW